MSKELLKSLPSIERLLASRTAARLSESFTRDRVRDLLRQMTEELRREIASGQWAAAHPPADAQAGAELQAEIERRLEARAASLTRASLTRVVNATGVIVHTNLGRSPLARVALDQVAEVAGHYSNLEYDLEVGERGRRESHCSELLARLAGSEAATVTNNNAAAVLLVLNSLAEGGEVIVSRGELVEIGGSFRIPDVMEKSGARLREVGTTNRTRVGDYAVAVNENTRLIMRVHPSNFRIVGFTERPSVEDIAELARRARVPSYEDLGSGCLIDLSAYGVRDEPVVARSLAAGISIVSFSGDKMLGGPQAGIIAGSQSLLDRVRSNPLMRALRVDKMTYAALEATLRLYERGAAEAEVPVLRAIRATREEITARASRLAEQIEKSLRGVTKASLEPGSSVIGGGSAPEVTLPTTLIAIEIDGMSASLIEERLRKHSTPVIARTERDRVMIDLRTVMADEERIILDALLALAGPVTRSAASKM